MQLPASIIPDLTAIRITGTDSSKFLDAQLSTNVSHLFIDQQQVAAWCNAKGQTIMVCLIQRLSDSEYLLICHRSLKSAVLKRLQLFILRSQVHLYDEDKLVCWVPPERLDLLQPWLGLDVTDQIIPEHQDTIQQWQNIQFESGFVWLNSATSQQFLPQMLALEKWQAIDYQKGCFPGQEIIARAHYLGRLKRHLWQAELSSRVTPGSIVMEQQQSLGTVLECFNDPTGKQNAVTALVVLSDLVEHSKACYVNTLNKTTISLIKMDKVSLQTVN